MKVDITHWIEIAIPIIFFIVFLATSVYFANKAVEDYKNENS